MLKLVFAACVLAPTVAMTVDEASKNIVNHVEQFNVGGSSLCSAHTCCNISATEACDVSSMPKDESTMVLPGGETRCIFADSTPFAFQVVPGDNDKILFYFQGGGACWDEASTKAKFCTTDSSPQSLNGLFDREDEKNRYKDHTIVHLSYCSGDLFGGDVVRDYDDSTGTPVTQKGQANAQSALDWIVQQTAAGHFAETLSELVVSGCSAGSIGAQLWGKPITDTLKWKKAAVTPDSYAGIFPPGTEGPLITAFGMCSASFLNPSLYDSCMAGNMTLRDYNIDAISRTPAIPFSFIQSKTDTTQESFYIAVGASSRAWGDIMTTPEKFYNDVNAQFGAYNVYPNFVTYLVDGNQHCFTPFDLYYTADPLSAKDDGESTSAMMMYDWVNSLPLESGEVIQTQCEGNLQGVQGINKQTYCSDDVSPKSFTEVW